MDKTELKRLRVLLEGIKRDNTEPDKVWLQASDALGTLDMIDRRSHPENKTLTCSGCEHNGLFENEIEYGYPSPCTMCKRRLTDNYLTKPEEGEKE